jgi:hypothetical protein
MGSVGDIIAYYIGDELHVSEVELLMMIFQTSHADRSSNAVILSAEMLVRSLIGNINQPNIWFTRESLLRLSTIVVEFICDSVSAKSRVVLTRRSAVFRQFNMIETLRTSARCSLTMCDVSPVPAVADFMIAGRSPWSGEDKPGATLEL